MKRFSLAAGIFLVGNLVLGICQARAASFLSLPNMSLGASGASVETLQHSLVSRGYLVMPPGVAFGYFGNLTRNAVMAFQRAQNITPVSGFVGPLTRAALEKEQRAFPPQQTSTPLREPPIPADVESSSTFFAHSVPAYLDQSFLLRVSQTAIVENYRQVRTTLEGITSTPCTQASTGSCPAVANLTVSYISDTMRGVQLAVGQSISLFGVDIVVSDINTQEHTATLVIHKQASGSSITVLSPNGGESWVVGRQYDIRWSAQDTVASVDISLVSQSSCGIATVACANSETPIAQSVKNSGSYSWTAGRSALSDVAIRTGSYRIKISDSVRGTFDVSDAPFSLIDNQHYQSTFIQVTSPNGGETVTAGTPTTITWTSAPPSGSWVALFLISPEGRSTFIDQRIEPTKGSYLWTPSANIASGNYKIEARLYTGPNLCVSTVVCTDVLPPTLLASDVSDGFFTLKVSSASRRVQLNDKFLLSVGESATVQLQGTDVFRVTFLTDACALPRMCAFAAGTFVLEALNPPLSSTLNILAGSSQTVGGYITSLVSMVNSQATLSVSAAPTQPITLKSDSGLNGTVGSSFQLNVYASGGKENSGYTFAVASGALPAGLSLKAVIPSCAPAASDVSGASCPPISSALVSGTPTQAGTYTATVSATDAAGTVGTLPLTIRIDAALPPTATACTQQMIIPAYFYPGALWDQSITTHTSGEIMIMNPNSGPGSASNADYVSAVNRAKSAGIKVLGYVHTSYGTRSSAEVKGEIDKYKQWYAVSGIFLDEGATDAAKVSYYRDVRSYIQSSIPGAITVLNPGTVPDESYMSAADIVMIFEDTYAAYKSWTPPAWASSYNSAQFAHLVHAASTDAAMKDALSLGAARRGGYMFVTNDVLPNPWDTVPPYFSSEVSGLSATCH